MASTNKTTNYELSQFIETDRPAWLTDYNSDMRKLDVALKAVSDTASGASGNVAALLERMMEAEADISTNANDIDALEARADTLEAQTQNITGAIGNINTEQIAQNAGIEAATQLGYNLARPYDSASTYAVGAYVLFQNTLYKCVTAVSTGEAFDPTKWLAIKATDEIAGGGTSIQVLRFNDPADFTLQMESFLYIFNLDHQSATMTTQTITNARIVEASLTYVKINNVKMLNGLFVINFDTIRNLPATCGTSCSFSVSLPATIENPSARVTNLPASLPYGTNSGLNTSSIVASRCSAELLPNRIDMNSGCIRSGANVSSLSVNAAGIAFSAIYV